MATKFRKQFYVSMLPSSVMMVTSSIIPFTWPWLPDSVGIVTRHRCCGHRVPLSWSSSFVVVIKFSNLYCFTTKTSSWCCVSIIIIKFCKHLLWLSHSMSKCTLSLLLKSYSNRQICWRFSLESSAHVSMVRNKKIVSQKLLILSYDLYDGINGICLSSSIML